MTANIRYGYERGRIVCKTSRVRTPVPLPLCQSGYAQRRCTTVPIMSTNQSDRRHALEFNANITNIYSVDCQWNNPSDSFTCTKLCPSDMTVAVNNYVNVASKFHGEWNNWRTSTLWVFQGPFFIIYNAIYCNACTVHKNAALPVHFFHRKFSTFRRSKMHKLYLIWLKLTLCVHPHAWFLVKLHIYKYTHLCVQAIFLSLDTILPVHCICTGNVVFLRT